MPQADERSVAVAIAGPRIQNRPINQKQITFWPLNVVGEETLPDEMHHLSSSASSARCIPKKVVRNFLCVFKRPDCLWSSLRESRVGNSESNFLLELLVGTSY